jgi:hypothetical protein
MSDTQTRQAGAPADEAYREFERKMELFEYGPRTTGFEQLIANGVQLPEPDSIGDAEVRVKLWEVIAGLARLRVYLDETDHLSDRELYAALWGDVLRVDVPAIDDVGFNHHIDLLSDGSEQGTALYLRYFAHEDARRHWLEDFPDYEMPAHEDPPHNRDRLLPRPSDEQGPEALEWLRANPNPSGLATNRFPTTGEAVQFVEALYAAGATHVAIENILLLPHDHWAPYADTLIVHLPECGAGRQQVFDLVKDVGRPDDEGEPFIDCGQPTARLRWD